MGNPATLPANFDGFDQQPPPSTKTLPATLPPDFQGFDDHQAPNTDHQVSVAPPDTFDSPFGSVHGWRDAIRNSAIGRSFHSEFPRASEAIGMDPTESIASPTYEQHRDQLLAPEYLIPDRSEHPILTGAAQAAGGLTSGQNLAIMGATAGAGGALGEVSPIASKVLGRLVSGGFSLDMLHGLYQKYGQFKKAVDAGDVDTAQQLVGQALVEGPLAGLTAHHAATGEGAIEDVRQTVQGAHPEATPATLPADFQGFDQEAPAQPATQPEAPVSRPPGTEATQEKPEPAAVSAPERGQPAAPGAAAAPAPTEFPAVHPEVEAAGGDLMRAGEIAYKRGQAEAAARHTATEFPALKDGQTTEQANRHPMYPGYTPERDELHRRIIDEKLANYAPAMQNAEPQITILGGGTASGKTTASRQIFGAEPNTVRLDPDEMKLDIPEYSALKESDPQGAARRVHDESSYLNKRALAEAVRRKLNIVYDTTTSGDARNKADLVDFLRTNGYKTRVLFADVPVDEAIRRSDLRAQESTDPINRGRYVPHDVIRQVHGEVSRNFEAIKDKADEAYLYDNSNPKDQGPTLVYSREGAEPEQVHRPDLYERFKQKGVEYEQGLSKAQGQAEGAQPALPGSGPDQNAGGPRGAEANGLPGVAGAAADRAVPVAGSGQTFHVPRADIYTDPKKFQPRGALNLERARDIAGNMKKRGAFGDSEPIDVWKDPNSGKLYVMSGHHRLKAAELAGLDTVTARIHEMPLKEAKEFARRSNESSMQLKPTELARAFQQEMGDGKSAEDVGKAYGNRKSSQVEDQTKLLNLSDELQKHVDAGMLDTPRAIALGKAVERHAIPPEIQQQVFDYVIKRREITPVQLGKLLDTFAPEAIKQVGFDFGDQKGFAGMEGRKGLATVMDEYLGKMRDLQRSKARLSGFLKEVDRMEREGEPLNRSTRGTRAEMQRRVKDLEKQLSQMEEDAASGKVFKTLGSAIEEGKQEAGPELTSPRAVQAPEEEAYPEVAPPDAEASLGGQQGLLMKRQRRAVRPEDSHELFAGVDEERAQAAAEHQGEALSEQVRSPLRSIDQDTGRMERESPLFRDSGASGQSGLFAGQEEESSPPETLHPQNTLFNATAVLQPQTARALFPNAMDWLRDMVRDKDDADSQTRSIVRQQTGMAARNKATLFKELESSAKAWDKRPTKDFVAFADAIENGKAQPNKADQPLADALRSILDDRRKAIQGLGTGKLENFIENYFPHIWKDPAKAVDVFRKIMAGRSPLQGPASFLRQRKIPTIVDGMIAGLKPETTNPVVMAMLKAHEMDRYLMAHQILGAMKDAGLVQYVKLGGKVPDGYTKINDTLFRVMQPIKYEDAHGYDQTALAIRGEYWAPKAAAKVLNNHLSPGLKGNAYYDAFRGASNALNQAQLGLSAFHLGFTTLDSSISDAAIAMQRFSRGELGTAAGAAARSAIPGISALDKYLKGNSDIKAYLDKKSQSLYAQAIERAGGRVQQDPIYKGEMPRQLREAIKDGNYGTALMKLLPAALEKASAPIMDHIVPRMKVGVFHDMAADIFSRAGRQQWSEDKITTELQKAWDSVDNRMGQMVYDNLFWNRAMKDLGLVSVRSLGWNLGTVREIGGGAKDFAQQGGKALAGGAGRPEVTNRMAYTMALPLITGLYGAMYAYAHGQKQFDDAKDYFFPKTGRKMANGDPERVSLPGYMKDLYAWKHNPYEVIGNKVHPAVAEMIQFLKNQDYYGTEIRHADDPIVQQMKDVGKWLLKNNLPFAIQGAYKRANTAGEYGAAAPLKPKAIEKTAESFIGIVPAAGYIVRSPAEELAHSYAAASFPQGPRTHEAAEKSQRRQGFEGRLRSGDIDQAGIRAAVKAGELTPKDAQAILQSGKSQGGIQGDFKKLSLEQALEVWDKARPAERAELRQALERKRGKLGDYLPEQRQELKERLQKALGKPGEPRVSAP